MSFSCQVTHKISSQLEDGAGKLNLAVTISGTTGAGACTKLKDNLPLLDPEAKTFLPMWDQSAEAAKKRKVTFVELQLREQYQQLPLPPPRMPLV